MFCLCLCVLKAISMYLRHIFLILKLFNRCCKNIYIDDCCVCNNDDDEMMNDKCNDDASANDNIFLPYLYVKIARAVKDFK